MPFKKFALAIHRASDSFLNVHGGKESLSVDEFYTFDLKEVKITADTRSKYCTEFLRQRIEEGPFVHGSEELKIF